MREKESRSERERLTEIMKEQADKVKIKKKNTVTSKKLEVSTQRKITYLLMSVFELSA